MSLKVLLIVSRHRDHMKIFPFGAATIYSALKNNHFDVDYIDCDYEHKNLDELITPKELSGYDIIAISGIISCYKHLKNILIPYVKESAPKAFIIIGGYVATSIPELLLNRKLCDVAFIGEGHESIIQFLKNFDDPDKWNEIQGIVFKDKKGNIINTGIKTSKSFGENIIPFYKFVDIEYYNSHLPKNKWTYPILIEIGCPYRCAFCFNSSGAFQHKIRDVESVVNELVEAKKLYNFSHANIMAENLMSKSQWVSDFCRLLDEKNLKFNWSCSGHANTINKDVLRLVKSHGCNQIGIGFENFSQRILDNMNKKVKVEKYKEIIRLFKKYDIDITGTCIFGYFGEDSTTVKENIDFMKKNYSPHEYFWIQPYPLTTFWNQCKEKGLIPDEEKLIEHLGEADDFVINATNLSDKELFSLKSKIDTTVKGLGNHKKLGNMILYIKAQGIQTALRKGIKLIFQR